jgi:hypothetical protein
MGGITVDLGTYARESAINRQAYRQLRDHIRHTYAGKYVAMARGLVVGASDTFDAARELVNGLDPKPEYFLVFPANVEPDFDLVYDLSGSR